MVNILSYEFAKLRKSKTVFISLAAMLAYTVFLGIIQVADSSALEYYGFSMSGALGLTDFAQNNYVLPFVIAIIVSSIVVNDYSHGIIRNMVMSGQARSKIYLSKFFVSTLLSVILFLLCAVIHTVILTMGYGFGDVAAAAYGSTLLHILLQYMAFTAFILLISDLTRSAGAAFGITLGLTLVFTIIGGFAIGYDYAAEEVVVNKTMQFIGDLYIGNLPASAADYGLETAVFMKYIVTAVAYLAGSLGIGMFLFEKRDLK